MHIIHLPHRTDRKIHICNELAKAQLNNYRFVDAIHGHTLDVNAMKVNEIISDDCRPLKRGEYGCYLSHLSIYHTILQSDEELHLILEDDVFFSINFEQRFYKLLSYVKHIDWDVLYLGINNYFRGGKKGIYVKPGVYYPFDYIWGTHAYIIKRSTLRRIIDIMLPIILPIDVMLMTMSLKKLVLTTNLIKAMRKDSDTQTIQ